MLWNEDGQGLTEYAVILTLVALVAVAGLTALGPLPAKGITHAAEAFKP
jgi:Flp pilus assembly pilin Flp